MTKSVLAIATLFSIVYGGCAFAKDKAANVPNNSNSKPKSTRAKLLINKEKNGTETGIYQQKLELRKPLTVNGKTVDGQHRIEISSSANYVGEKPSCASERVAMNILHEKPKKSGWQFATKPKVAWVIDGKTSLPEKILNAPIELEEGSWWESLITRPSCETLQQIASAKEIQLKIDAAVLELSTEEIDTLKEFSSALGF